MLTYRKTVGAGVAALAASLLSTTAAFAAAGAITHSGSPVNFATQAVSASTGGGTVSIPAGTASVQVSQISTSASSSVSITFTLPSGVTFTSTPTLTGSGTLAPSSTTAAAGGSGASSVTYTVALTANTGPADLLLSLGLFSVSGATSLATKTITGPAGATSTSASSLATTNDTGFVISEKITGSSGVFVANSATSLTQTTGQAIALAGSLSALVVGSSTSASNVETGSATLLNGQSNPGKIWNSTLLSNKLGTVTPSEASTVQADGISTFTFGTAKPTLTLTGNLLGITSVFLDISNGTCAADATTEAAVTNVITGSISGGTATFSNLPLASAGTVSGICAYTDGTKVLGTNQSGLVTKVAVANPSSGTTTTTAGTRVGTNQYSAGTPYFVTYSGNNAAYPMFLRVVNNAAASITVYAHVQDDAGNEGSCFVENPLAANTNDLVPVSTIVSNCGLAPANNRASLILYAAPANGAVEIGTGSSNSFGDGAVGLSQLLLNPDGTVVQLGGNSSP